MTPASMLLALGLLAAPATAGPGTRYGRVIAPGGVVLRVELAETPEAQARGYMFRDRVGPEDGMLFIFEDTGIRPFWMKNTRIALDIIWIGDDGKVVQVAPAVPPCAGDPCPDVRPTAAARYVLELAAGRGEALGIRVGVDLQILIPPPAGEAND